MLAAELQRAAVAATGRAVRHGSRLVRFRVNGFDVTTSEETTRCFPDSYLGWLVTNCEEEVVTGRPICIKTSPFYFSKLVRRLSGLREHGVQPSPPVRRRGQGAGTKRRKGLDPPPFTAKRKYRPSGRRTNICEIASPLPGTGWDMTSTVSVTVAAIVEAVRSLWSASRQYFDRVVVVLTTGKTHTGVPLIWPYFCHLCNSQTSAISDLWIVKNQDIRTMDPAELEELYRSVDISPELQHRVKRYMRLRGYSCIFSDMKMNPNNFVHWRVTRMTDCGVRSLDGAYTVRCLVVNI